MGKFVEPEVGLESDSEAEEGRRLAREIMGSLNIDQQSLIPGSYVDLASQNK